MGFRLVKLVYVQSKYIKSLRVENVDFLGVSQGPDSSKISTLLSPGLSLFSTGSSVSTIRRFGSEYGSTVLTGAYEKDNRTKRRKVVMFS